MAPSNQRNRQCVLVFLKVPPQASVKTRLEQFLDKDVVVKLYKHFVADILELLERGGYHVIICFYPPQARADVAGWLGHNLSLRPQQGRNLGERMATAFYETFAQGFQQVLLLGTDFPDLPDSFVDEAFKHLPHHDAVIGPAVDGGYYLIGFNSHTFLAEIFDDMPWGTADVYQRTLTVFSIKGCKIHVLPKWCDIDTYQDLERFIKTNLRHQTTALNTVAYLSSIGFGSEKG
jgi:rSAM/selenodomain-associated transferase 1